MDEARTRQDIDAQLEASGWVVQDHRDLNLYAGAGVAVREFPMASGHGFADYLLFVDGQAVGALEAKREGATLRGVEGQAEKYAAGLPAELHTPVRPLPFVYLSNGAETLFVNGLDPRPRTRDIYAPHRPETLAEWLEAPPIPTWATEHIGRLAVAEEWPGYTTHPSSFRGRVQALPPLHEDALWPNQIDAIKNLEESLRADRPRALLQMATGSGKTFTIVNALYRLIKFAGARRVLFLVDRKNLGEQAEGEFRNFVTPDDQRKLEELYVIQLLGRAGIGDASKVVISTIQRMYSMLRGTEPEEYDEVLDEGSGFLGNTPEPTDPVDVAYNPQIPPETFDLVVVDECHRSIYTLWRQVLEYFDAHLIGLTATPAKHTFAFFHKNLVMQYGHAQAVADGVNVDFDVYRIRTEIGEQGATVPAGYDTAIIDRRTRRKRWETLEDELDYDAAALDRRVQTPDQIRTVIRTFKQALDAGELFHGREYVPKTLIFAKDDAHAETIVDIVRQEFGKGNAFCKKITYKVSDTTPKQLIRDFRTDLNPRIAVTVDMIATGTDIRPIEIVMFMRAVKSRLLFEQMKGRGARTASKDDMLNVTPDAKHAKERFVIVDAVGITEQPMSDTTPLDRERSISFDKLLMNVAAGTTDEAQLSSLASRLARLDRKIDGTARERIRELTDGTALHDLTHAIVSAIDPDERQRAAEEAAGGEPSKEQVEAAGRKLASEATRPLASNPPLRELLVELSRASQEMVIDDANVDTLIEAGYSKDAKDRAKSLVDDFRAYLDEHKDEIDALQFFYSRPRGARLTFAQIKDLANAIKLPPRSWTPKKLWAAYEVLEADRVRGAAGKRALTDLVSLVRHALGQDDELVPYVDGVEQRFASWLAEQEAAGRGFTDEQRRWLEMIKDHVAQSVEITTDDFDYTPFVGEGGLGKAAEVFGGELRKVVDELNEVLAA